MSWGFFSKGPYYVVIHMPDGRTIVSRFELRHIANMALESSAPHGVKANESDPYVIKAKEQVDLGLTDWPVTLYTGKV